MGHKFQKISRGGGGFRPPLPSDAYLFVRNYIKKRGKGLKNACYGLINSKNFHGGVFRPPLHNPPTNLFVENYMKNGGKGLKNASFWVIHSKNFRPAPRRKLIRRGKKMISKCTIYTPACFIYALRNQSINEIKSILPKICIKPLMMLTKKCLFCLGQRFFASSPSHDCTFSEAFIALFLFVTILSFGVK